MLDAAYRTQLLDDGKVGAIFDKFCWLLIRSRLRYIRKFQVKVQSYASC